MNNMAIVERRYAGFWIRFVASLIDGLVLGIPLFCIQMFINLLILVPAMGNESQMAAANITAVFVNGLFSLIATIIYYVLMESSKKQATIGKMIFGIKVVDENGGRISVGRAIGRYFGKYLSGMIFYIGYIMAAFTKEKRALHDFIAKTYVVKTN